jgi:carbonic anhydrase
MTDWSSRTVRLAVASVFITFVASIGGPAATAAPVPTGAPPAGSGTATATWSHDPASPTGPTHWAALDPAWTACGNREGQSPIAITATRKANLPVLRVDYARVPLVVENTGHVVEVPQPPAGGGTLTFGARSYQLTQWHIHAPSEHVLNGHRADLEIHLVHTDAQGNTAVLAVFADVTSHRTDGRSANLRAATWAASKLLRTVLRAAPDTAGEETDLGHDVSAAVLLGAIGRGFGGHRVLPHYFTYTGSLTTPACTGGVRWLVVPSTIRIDLQSVCHMHGLIAAFPGYGGYPNNNRPLQPLGSRTVERRAAG